MSISNLEIPESCQRVPGFSFLRCFLHSTDAVSENTFVLRLPKVSGRAKLIYRVLRWALLIFLPIALVQDSLDIALGFYKTKDLQTKYGKAEPVIVLMTYCTSILALLMAMYTVIFLCLKRAKILKTFAVLEELTNMLQIKPSHVQSQLRELQICFWMALALGITGYLVCTLSNPEFYRTFAVPVNCGYIDTILGLTKLYYRGTIFYGTMIHFSALGVFAYVNVFLLACSREVSREQAQFLSIYQNDTAAQSDKIPNEMYVTKLKRWLHHNVKLKEAFDEVQKTFCWKLLLDTATLCLGLLIQLAYISTWLLKPTTDLTIMETFVNLIRHILYLVTYLLCGWIVLYRPLALYKMHHNRSDMLGKILAERRRSSCEEPSNEEIMLSMMVMKKADDGDLVYNAGTILPLGPKVGSTISAAVFAFGWFVIQRSLDFKGKL
ncbi:hypothetical protein BV898_05973 [Hypsibius exemplaris]|uniref:Gustatory receptor n=1 Tax=Hypsibius exemplaris TaxID=2072580 RepID=A0A1W0WXM7_HYPEX|nr:hypothetical protein BV898_05973 [Hypsibius exemplaris]